MIVPVKFFRLNTGLTQIEIARAAQIPQSTVSRLESGGFRRDTPRLREAKTRIAEVLGVAPVLLFPLEDRGK